MLSLSSGDRRLGVRGAIPNLSRLDSSYEVGNVVAVFRDRLV